MSKILPLLHCSLLALAGTIMATGAAQADARAASTSSASSVKSGVDAWSVGNYDAAVRQWQPLADRGDADAQFNLAQAYKLGRGVPMDLGKAEDFYGKAAAKGHLQAADAYGLLLFQRGERAKALPYVQASAERGDARAQYILGVAHFNGDLVPKDWVRAYALVSLAQQEGLAQATGAKQQMDQHVPLADRQKSVVMAQQIAARAQANRQRINASAELGTRLASTSPQPGGAATPGAVAQAARPAPTPARPAASPPRPLNPAAAKPAPAASGPWRIQLGAFGVAGNAEALWAKVKGRAELAGHAKALAPAGKLTKLQATGFASKADADAACARLTAGGFGCLPVRN